MAYKILGQGTLTTTASTVLYTVPTGKECAVTSIRLVNTGGSARTINIYVKQSGGTARNYSDKDYSLSAGAGLQVLDDPQELRLSAGDEIQGGASANTDVHFTICGVES